MKLNFGRRLVLFVHWLLSLTICGIMVAMIVWPECMETTKRLLDDRTQLIYAIAMLVVYLLFAVGTVAITFSGPKKDGDHGFIVVDSSETGRTRIAVVAVEQMIRQAVRGVSGIAEMKAAINNDTDSISINVDAAILNGAHVPTVTANIQRAIRSYIELNCGVTVRGVSVSVHSLTNEEPVGRRGRRRAAAVNVEPVAKYSAPVKAPLPEAEEPVNTYSAPEEPVWTEPASAEEPAAEQSAPEEASTSKKGLFKGLFGKRNAAKDEEAPAPEAAEEEAAPEVIEEAVSEETEEAMPEAIEEAAPAEEPAVPEFTIGSHDDQDDGGEAEA